jgi:hypothetical protein
MSIRERTTSGPTLMQRVWTWLHNQPRPQQNGAIRDGLGITRNQVFSAMRDLKRVNAARLEYGKGRKGEPGRPVWKAIGFECPKDLRLVERKPKVKLPPGARFGWNYKPTELDAAWPMQRNAPRIGADD